MPAQDVLDWATDLTPKHNVRFSSSAFIDEGLHVLKRS